MAIMCPIEKNDYFHPESNEQEMYKILQTQLDDDFYVFHSLRMLDVDAGLEEREADFVVFHQKLGLLFIEAKILAHALKIKHGTMAVGYKWSMVVHLYKHLLPCINL